MRFEQKKNVLCSIEQSGVANIFNLTHDWSSTHEVQELLLPYGTNRLYINTPFTRGIYCRLLEVIALSNFPK